MITVHLEACEDVYAAFGKIRESGLKAGLSICPETEADAVRPYLKDVDMILVMCVHPGFGGQKFIPESLDKIRKIREMIQEEGLTVDIQVDGGICLTCGRCWMRARMLSWQAPLYLTEIPVKIRRILWRY